MVNLRLIHDFLKDPLTDKLFHKYVRDQKARQVFDTSVRLVEIAIIAVPLIVSATRGLRDVVNSGGSKRSSRMRRLIPA